MARDRGSGCVCVRERERTRREKRVLYPGALVAALGRLPKPWSDLL